MDKIFRVYSTYEKQMIYEDLYDYISFDGNGKVNTNAGLGEHYLMQCTGEMAKGGQMIYEGDVVLKPSGLKEAVEIIHEGEKLTAYRDKTPEKVFIIWHEGKFVGHNKSKIEMLDNPYYGVLNYTGELYAYKLEVIGNVYENPELCEGN